MLTSKKKKKENVLKRKGRRRKKRKTVAYMALDFDFVWFSTEEMWLLGLVHLFYFMDEMTKFQKQHGVEETAKALQ